MSPRRFRRAPKRKIIAFDDDSPLALSFVPASSTSSNMTPGENGVLLSTPSRPAKSLNVAKAERPKAVQPAGELQGDSVPKETYYSAQDLKGPTYEYHNYPHGFPYFSDQPLGTVEQTLSKRATSESPASTCDYNAAYEVFGTGLLLESRCGRKPSLQDFESVASLFQTNIHHYDSSLDQLDLPNVDENRGCSSVSGRSPFGTQWTAQLPLRPRLISQSTNSTTAEGLRNINLDYVVNLQDSNTADAETTDSGDFLPDNDYVDRMRHIFNSETMHIALPTRQSTPTTLDIPESSLLFESEMLDVDNLPEVEGFARTKDRGPRGNSGSADGVQNHYSLGTGPSNTTSDVHSSQALHKSFHQSPFSWELWSIGNCVRDIEAIPEQCLRQPSKNIVRSADRLAASVEKCLKTIIGHIQKTRALHEAKCREKSIFLRSRDYFDDALRFVRAVKGCYSSRCFAKLLKVLQEYHANTATVEHVAASLESLFYWSPQLLRDVQQFYSEPALRALSLAAVSP